MRLEPDAGEGEAYREAQDKIVALLQHVFTGHSRMLMQIFEEMRGNRVGCESLREQYNDRLMEKLQPHPLERKRAYATTPP